VATRTQDLGDQLPLFGGATEHARFLKEQLVTYIGNKRTLLPQIEAAVEMVRTRLGRDRLTILDAFSGSGVVSRLFKRHADQLVVNDFEGYARVVSECYLTNRSDVDLDQLADVVRSMNAAVDAWTGPSGFIERLYAPADEFNIQPAERVFYTPANARRLDAYRQLISMQDELIQHLLLGPLLSEASVHANTAGVFKGFYKDSATGVGKFGGTGADALSRIKAPIVLSSPVLSRFECDHDVHQEDANLLVPKLGPFDLAYFDPPYNQHPYGSNYFMLNLLVDYEEPVEVSRVSGIPTSWGRSGYNVRTQSMRLLEELLRSVDARFILLSFNDEGFIKPAVLHELLRRLGTVHAVEVKYNAFRGSRNLANRPTHVTEHLFLVERA
jgi:adenine-specific DNA-methyltransferase